MASSILTPHDSCDLKSPMRTTQQNWHRPQDQPASPGEVGIDPRLGEAALRAPAVSRKDYHSQAILQPRVA